MGLEARVDARALEVLLECDGERSMDDLVKEAGPFEKKAQLSVSLFSRDPDLVLALREATGSGSQRARG